MGGVFNYSTAPVVSFCRLQTLVPCLGWGLQLLNSPSSFSQSSLSVLLKKLKIKTVQSQGLLSSELDETHLNGLSQLSDEERILTTSSLKSILFNKWKSETQIIAICTKQK